jgi:hypothetical protein
MRALALVMAGSLISGCFTAGGVFAGYKQAQWSNEQREEELRRGEPVEPPRDPKMSAAAAGTVGLMLDIALTVLFLKSDTI